MILRRLLIWLAPVAFGIIRKRMKQRRGGGRDRY